MNLQQAIEVIERALENPVSTGLDFTPKNVPLVLFDDEGVAFINHPNPSEERPIFCSIMRAQVVGCSPKKPAWMKLPG